MKNVTKLKGVHGWVFILFADPTDTWWSAIGLFLFYVLKSDKIKKIENPILGFCVIAALRCKNVKVGQNSLDPWN